MSIATEKSTVIISRLLSKHLVPKRLSQHETLDFTDIARWNIEIHNFIFSGVHIPVTIVLKFSGCSSRAFKIFYDVKRWLPEDFWAREVIDLNSIV